MKEEMGELVGGSRDERQWMTRRGRIMAFLCFFLVFSWTIFLYIVGGRSLEQSQSIMHLDIFGYTALFVLIYQGLYRKSRAVIGSLLVIQLFLDLTVTHSNGGFSALWTTPPGMVTMIFGFVVYPHFWAVPGIGQTVKVLYFYFVGPGNEVSDTSFHELFVHLMTVIITAIAVTWVLKERAQALAKLKHTTEHRREFLTSVTHELRTPIAGAIGNIELLKQDHTHVAQREVLAENALVCSRSALNLMDRLLEWSKTAASTPEQAWFPLRSLCADVEAIVGQQMRSKGLTFEVEAVPGVRVKGDEAKVLQILTNLIWNASKYTPEGGCVRLWAYVEDAPPASGSSRSIGGWSRAVVYEVSDTGIGLDQRQLRYIFQPFKQLNEKSEGVGLGLAIATDLCRQMGGTIEAQSAGRGKGSTFRLVFAGAQVAQEEEGAGALCAVRPAPALSSNAKESLGSSSNGSVGGGSGGVASRDLSILVVEDTELLRKLLIQQLGRLGCVHVAAVASGLEAVQFLEDHTVDVVLTDVMMPGGIDGFELTWLIRHKGWPCRVYGVSALTDEEFCAKGKRLGMTGYLTKPVKLSALSDILC